MAGKPGAKRIIQKSLTTGLAWLIMRLAEEGFFDNIGWYSLTLRASFLKIVWFL
jgi:hypothetical protein